MSIIKSKDLTLMQAIKSTNGTVTKISNLVTNCCAKLMVYFRPSPTYIGEFGFDWIKGDDLDDLLSYVSGDLFPSDLGMIRIIDKDIVGEYPNQTNRNYPGTFQVNADEYKKLCQTFDQKQHNMHSSGLPLYNTPVMTIYPNKSVELELKMHIMQPAKGIHLSYNSDLFKLTPANNLSAPLGLSKLNLKIECLKSFNEDQYIKLIAGGKFVGQLKILANEDLYEVKIVLVDVKTNFGVIDKIGHHAGMEDLLKRYLKQAYIKPIFESLILDATNPIFTRNNSISGYLSKTGSVMQAELDTLLYNKYDTTKDYRDFYRIYFIDENDVSNGLYGQAADILSKSVFISTKGLGDSTPAHELFHAMGLYHTFDINSQFVYEKYETDNIMDYSDIGAKQIHVNRLYHWQWKVLQDASEKID